MRFTLCCRFVAIAFYVSLAGNSLFAPYLPDSLWGYLPSFFQNMGYGNTVSQEGESRLEGLPPEILERIVSELDLESRHRLVKAFSFFEDVLESCLTREVARKKKKLDARLRTSPTYMLFSDHRASEELFSATAPEKTGKKIADKLKTKVFEMPVRFDDLLGTHQRHPAFWDLSRIRSTDVAAALRWVVWGRYENELDSIDSMAAVFWLNGFFYRRSSLMLSHYFSDADERIESLYDGGLCGHPPCSARCALRLGNLLHARQLEALSVECSDVQFDPPFFHVLSHMNLQCLRSVSITFEDAYETPAERKILGVELANLTSSLQNLQFLCVVLVEDEEDTWVKRFLSCAKADKIKMMTFFQKRRSWFWNAPVLKYVWTTGF